MYGSVAYMQKHATYLLLFAKSAITALSVFFIIILIGKFIYLLLSGPGFLMEQRQLSDSGLPRASTHMVDTTLLSRMSPFVTLLAKRTSGPDSFALSNDAPETDLSVVLNGVRAGRSGGGVAFITLNDGAQERYVVGDELRGLRGVILERIYADGVLLNKNGKIERLSNDKKGSGGIQSVAGVNQVDRLPSSLSVAEEFSASESESTELEKVADKSPTRILETKLSKKDIESFMDWARFDPKTPDNIRGMVVYPVNSSMFAKSGLKARDIITSVNGLDLGAQDVVGELSSLIEATHSLQIVLLRSGEVVNLNISVTS